MRRIFTPFCFAFLLICFSRGAQAQSVIYQASFSGSQHDWFDYSDTYTTEKIANNKFCITQKRNKSSYRAVEVAVEDGRNYRIETTVTHVSGDEESAAGLVFAGDGENNNYFFTISASGNYFFAYREGGVFKAIIRATKSKAIKRGANAANKLAIETDADNLRLYINDQLIAKTKMGLAFGNDIGFIAEREQTAAFDYLTVTYLKDATDNSQPDKQVAVQPVKDQASHSAGIVPAAIVTPAAVVVPPPVTISNTTTVKDTTKPAVSPAANVTVNHTVAAKDTGARQTIQPANTVANQPKKDTVKQPASTVVATVVTPAPKDSFSQSTHVNPKNDQQVKDVANVVVAPIVQPAVNKPVSAAITQLVYYTDFTKDDENGWTTQKVDSALVSLDNGTLRIARTGKNGYTSILSSAKTPVDMRRNFILETEVTHNSGLKNYGYGLAFGADSLQQYYFCITDSGSYYINQVDKSIFHTIVGFTASDAIHTGDNAKNKLTIKHIDGQLYFYINDQRVETHVDFTYSGNQFGMCVTFAQGVSYNHLSFGYTDKPIVKLSADTLPQWPKVVIISPEVTRGLKIVQNSDMLHIVGKAMDPVGIFSVQVNDVQANFDAAGNFLADIPMFIGDNPLRVTVLDSNMKRGTFNFHIVRNVISVDEQAAVSKLADQGKYYALIVGVQNYQDTNIGSLEGPIDDAGKLKLALIKNYTFEPENVRLLKDPSRAEFLEALDDLSTTVKNDDNLVIFYAGHGLYDENRQQGYWLPADAIRKRRDTWISNTELIDEIYAIKSKHTLLISDACFSGSIFKARGIELAPKNIQQVYKLLSRKAMTSGAMTEVPDKSVFMEYLLKGLNTNTDDFLPAEILFANFKAAVINNSTNGQVPQFGEIKGAGDEGGDFIFIKRPPKQ